ncbi:MAG: hypothetical protein NVSMB1_25820 [Polyangiales bacterium]
MNPRGVYAAVLEERFKPVGTRLTVSTILGAGPFHAKGLVYHGARDYYDLKVPGGSGAARARAIKKHPELARFFDNAMIAGGWYDVMPILPYSLAAAELSQIPHSQLVRENAAWLARRDLRGVYRVVLSLASIDLIATRVPALSMRYFDFGSADATIFGKGVMESSRKGIPRDLVEWFVWAVEGFVPVSLKLAGAREVTVSVVAIERDNRNAATALDTIRFRIAWVA